MPTRWCPAEVLHISESPDQDSLAKAAIRYLPGDTWDQQFEFVDFLEGSTLRCSSTCDHTEPEEHNRSYAVRCTNGNPHLEWRYTKEQAVLTEQSSSESDDDTWKIENPDDANAKRRRTLNRVKQRGERRNRYDVEMTAMRDGHAALSVEIEKLKRELVNMSRRLDQMTTSKDWSGKCSTAACVLPHIRQKMALKMQGGLRKLPNPAKPGKKKDADQDLSISYVDGFLPGIMRARVECSLQQFESVSRHIRARSPSDAVYFSPEFSYTQLPLQSSQEFRVLFKTFTHLCNVIGIASPSDMKEMARKCGSSPKGDVLRILGTYCYDATDECRSALVFPGTSCGNSTPQQFERLADGNGESTDASGRTDPFFPVLIRKTREWDKVDGRYRHKLRLNRVELPPLNEHFSEDKAFCMVWKRAAELGGRAWSHALCDPGEVFGWLELSIPFVQTVGKQLCQELGGVGNDDMWDELLAIGRKGM